MIHELGLPELPFGINSTLGMCGNERNEYQRYPAPAYSMAKNTIITVGAQDVFHDSFPTDFSILAVLRLQIQVENVTVFSIYSSESIKVVSLIVGKNIALYYEDLDGNPFENSIISFDIGITDTR